MERFNESISALGDAVEVYLDRLKDFEYTLRVCDDCSGLESCKSFTAGYTIAGISTDLGFPQSTYGYCRYELARREQERINKLLQSSRIKKRFKFRTIENFNVDDSNRKAYEAIKKYIDTFDVEKGQGLILFGPTGTGKSHLALATLQELIKKGHPGAYVTVPELLDEIRESYNSSEKGDGVKLLELVKTIPVLVLDDLGTEKPTEWVRERLYVIINARYEDMKPTIVTTNCSLEELEERVGDRVVSRLWEVCKGLVLGGRDRRKCR